MKKIRLKTSENFDFDDYLTNLELIFSNSLGLNTIRTNKNLIVKPTFMIYINNMFAIFSSYSVSDTKFISDLKQSIASKILIKPFMNYYCSFNYLDEELFISIKKKASIFIYILYVPYFTTLFLFILLAQSETASYTKVTNTAIYCYLIIAIFIFPIFSFRYIKSFSPYQIIMETTRLYLRQNRIEWRKLKNQKKVKGIKE